MPILKLQSVRVASPVPWDGQAMTNTLVVRTHAGAPNGSLELDSDARIIVVTNRAGKKGLIPMENVVFMEPLVAEPATKVAQPPAPPPPPKPAVSDVVKFAKDAKGNVVEVKPKSTPA